MAISNLTVGGAGIAGSTWTIQSINTATVGRFHDLGFLQEGAAGNSGFTQARPGCLAGPTDSGSQIPNCFAAAANGTLFIAIRRGAAIVERTSLSGPYQVHTRASGSVGLGTADATNPRIDRVDLQVFDGAQGDNGGVSLTQFLVTQGVASGTPVVPGAPANSTPIVQCRLPANTTVITNAMLTDVRKSAGIRGAIRPMLPGDLLTDPGFMSGEVRDTTNVAPVPTWDRWNAATAAWQRVVELVPPATQFFGFTGAQAVTSTSSTVYVNVVTGSTLCGTGFVAPASGIVRIGFGMNANSTTGGSTVFLTAAVALGGTVGSGTSVVAANDDRAALFSNTLGSPGYRVFYVTGLTPGSTYNAWLMWRNSGAASANGNRPFIEVEPKAA